MAGAIIEGLISSGVPPEQILASNPSASKLDKLTASCGIKTTSDNRRAAKRGDIVVLAIKPQMLPGVCSQLASIDFSNKLIISIAAGITIEQINLLISSSSAIVRAMPNTPATVSKGATGLYANVQTNKTQKLITDSIFSAIGMAEWVEEESLIDVVTAIAGSAPAYVFQFIQSMVEQAVTEGMPAQTARNLATQAVLGASTLAQIQHHRSLEELRVAVTSPGGTTAAALASFEVNGFSNIIKKGVAAAAARGRELGEKA